MMGGTGFGRTGRAVAAVVAALLAVAPGRAEAQETGEAGFEGFFVEVPVGLAMPVGEGGYEGLQDPSFNLGANLGYLFSLGDWTVAAGPALDIAYTIGNVDQDWHHADAYEDDLYLGRLRLVGGGRFVVGFGSAYLLTRIGVGMDYVHASWEYDEGGTHHEGDDSDVGFGMLVGFGMGYRITDLISVAMLIDFPIGFHDEDDPPDEVNWDFEMIDLLTSVAVVFHL